MMDTKKQNIENKVIFDSQNYLNEYDENYITEDLDYLLSETIIEPRGEIVGWMFLSKRSSHYGSISNNGKTGYKKVGQVDLATAILNVNADRIIIENDEGLMKVSYYDHDGTNHCVIKPISKSREKSIENKLHDFDKLIEYVKTMPSIRIKSTKPTK